MPNQNTVRAQRERGREKLVAGSDKRADSQFITVQVVGQTLTAVGALPHTTAGEPPVSVSPGLGAMAGGVAAPGVASLAAAPPFTQVCAVLFTLPPP